MDTPTNPVDPPPDRVRRLTSDQARKLFESMLDSDSSGADEDWGENDHDVNSDRSSDSSDSETVETDRPRSRSRSTSVVTIPTPRSTSANARSSDSEDELVPSTSNGKRKGNRSRSRPMGKAAAKKPRQAQSSTIEVAPAVARDEEVSGWVNADPLQATQRSFHFRGNCGSKLNNLDGTSEALEFFFALLDEEVQDDLIKEINAYAEVQIQKNTPLTKHSRYRDWEPIDQYQLYKFLAVLIAMGMDPRPYLSDFWSTNGQLYTPWYGAMFPRRKFQIVYHSMLHVCEPDANGKAKIEPFINTLLGKFQRSFYPFQNLSIDEMVIGFKGRFQHKQYNAAKPKKHHIKTFGLCDSVTGYVYNLLIYFGKDTSYIPENDANSSQAVNIFRTLMAPLQDSGHHIFADRYYTSAPVIEHLSSQRFYYTGTLNVNRRDFPPELKTMRLEHMEQRYFYHEERDILCVTWKDKKAKKPCIVVSTNSQVGSIDLTEGRRQLSKPIMIQDYNVHMNGCDRADQMISYYSTYNHKTRKWWKKLFLWILEVTQVNAHILYVLSRPDQPKKIPFSTFKDSLVAQLEKKAAGITPVAIATAASHRTKHANVANAVERFQGNKHLVDYDGADVRCVLCAKEGKRARTSYFCTGCSEKPHLCIKKCFFKYHTQ